MEKKELRILALNIFIFVFVPMGTIAVGSYYLCRYRKKRALAKKESELNQLKNSEIADSDGK